MTKTKNKLYYVYTHTDPETDELVYVGKGYGGRAWDCTRSRDYNTPHREWMDNLLHKGYTPDKWVTIIHSGLAEEKAFELEREFIHNNGIAKFTNYFGERNHRAKLTDAQAKEIYTRKAENHTKLAKEFGVAHSTIWQITSGRQWKATTADLRKQDD